MMRGVLCVGDVWLGVGGRGGSMNVAMGTRSDFLHTKFNTILKLSLKRANVRYSVLPYLLYTRICICSLDC